MDTDLEIRWTGIKSSNAATVTLSFFGKLVEMDAFRDARG
jgi:hypothetical protein